MSFDTSIEQSDINVGMSYRAKNNATDLKIAIENIKIAPPINHSLLTQRQFLNMSSIEAR